MYKNIIKTWIICLVVIGTVACSGTPLKPAIETSEKFNVKNIKLSVVELVKPDIEYHTESEIQDLVIKKIKSNLAQANLISEDKSMNSIDITMTYHRRFVGDQTPIPSDSLGYPIFDYEIVVKDGDKLLTTLSKKKLTYQGGFMMNLKVIAGQLREKSDENPFIEALSNSISESIKSLK